MKRLWILVFMTASLAAVAQTTKPQATLTPYVIVAHAGYEYTVRHGHNILKVNYYDSQTSTAKPGDALGTGLHYHFRDGVYPHGPDLSQVPEVGSPINQCVLDKTPDTSGGPVIAHQLTPAPCMMQNGNMLQYEPSPNAGDFTYVSFDIVSERLATK